MPFDWVIEVLNSDEEVVATTEPNVEDDVFDIISIGSGQYVALGNAEVETPYVVEGDYTVYMKDDEGTVIASDEFTVAAAEAGDEDEGPAYSIEVVNSVRPGELVTIDLLDVEGEHVDLPEGGSLTAYYYPEAAAQIVAMSDLEEAFEDDGVEIVVIENNGEGLYVFTAHDDEDTYTVSLRVDGELIETETYEVDAAVPESLQVYDGNDLDDNTFSPGEVVTMHIVADDDAGIALPDGWTLGAYYVDDEDGVVVVGLSSVEEPIEVEQLDGSMETVYPIELIPPNVVHYKMTAPAHFYEYFVELKNDGVLVDTASFFVTAVDVDDDDDDGVDAGDEIDDGENDVGDDHQEGQVPEDDDNPDDAYSQEFRTFLENDLDAEGVLDLGLDEEAEDENGNLVCVDIDGHWAYEILTELLASRVYPISRVDGEIFCRPDEEISRAEFVVWLLVFSHPEEVMDMAWGWDADDIPFSDLEPDNPYTPYIMLAHELGIIHGYGDGTVGVDNTINRAELLKILLTSLGVFTGTDEEIAELEAEYPDKAPVLLFEDIDHEDEWYYPYLYWAAAHDVIEGRTEEVDGEEVRMASMGSPITYAEAAKLFRMILVQY